jgi:hypothetical protein
MLYEVVQAPLPGWIIPVLMISIALATTLSLAFFLKWTYSRDFIPTKKHKHGCIVCTFHPKNGRPYSKILPIEDNGHSVKSPSNNISKNGEKFEKFLHYEFDEDSQETIKWPSSVFMGLTILQTDAPRVNWWENDPNPWKRRQIVGWEKEKETGKLVKDRLGNYLPIYQYATPLLTAERIDEIKDNASLETQNIIEAELAKQQQELRKALASKINPMILYIGIALAVIAAVVAAYFGFKIYDLLQSTGGLI